MAWEKRKHGRYYYRKRRTGDKVVSEYVGAGPVAEIVALADESERQRREHERQKWQAERAADRAQIGQVEDAMKLVRAITAGVCIAAGGYQHKRQWRCYAASDTARSHSE